MNPLLFYYPMLILHIVNPQVRQLYHSQSKYLDDAGYDIKFPQDVNFIAHQTQWIDFQISPHMKIDSSQSWGYLIAPRSSISMTPLRLVVSPGVIDASYVGHLRIPFQSQSHHNYSVLRGQSICGPNYFPNSPTIPCQYHRFPQSKTNNPRLKGIWVNESGTHLSKYVKPKIDPL